jgi:dihydropteroate synthase
MVLNCRGRVLDLSKPVVMGILNATPDSYLADSRVSTVSSAVAKAAEMISQGAKIIDVGGQSTRPGSDLISAEEEASRVLPIIEAICLQVPEALVSIDTYYPSVAAAALSLGAHIVNDISGGQHDEAIYQVAGDAHAPYVCMHMRGTPQNMIGLTDYDDLNLAIFDYFLARRAKIEAAGVKDIIYDIGFGFAKNIEQSFDIIKELHTFVRCFSPLLLGISRKSLIYKTLGIKVEDSLSATTALHAYSLMQGVSILRVHDVRAAVDAIEILRQIPMTSTYANGNF